MRITHVLKNAGGKNAKKVSKEGESDSVREKTEAGKRLESEPRAIRGDGRGSIFYEVFCRLRSLLRAAGGRERDGAEKLFFPSAAAAAA